MPPGQDDYEDDWDNGNDNEDMNVESLTSHEASDAALAVAVKLHSACESCPDASPTVADLSFWVSLFCIPAFDKILRQALHLGGNS